MKQRLYSFKFQEGKGITDQLQEFSKTVDDLENIDVAIEDEDKAIILLNSVPKSFDQLKDAMLFGRDSSITLEEVMAALKTKEFQTSSSKPVDQMAESLNVKPEGKKAFKKKFQKKKQGQEKPLDAKETRSCHYCKKPGHLKKNCYAWKRKQSEEEKGANAADIAEEVQTAEILNVMDSDITESWIMDSGCSFHMCPHIEWFQDLEISSGSVLLGNDQVCRVKGIGSIKFKLDDGSIKVLSDVRYIPEIKRNLISLGALEKKGYGFISSGGEMKVMAGDRVILRAERRRSLYYLLGEVIKGGTECSSQ